MLSDEGWFVVRGRPRLGENSKKALTSNREFTTLQKVDREETPLMYAPNRRTNEPFVVRYPVVKKEVKFPFDHNGEEFILVTKARVDLVYGGKKIVLKEGDSAHFAPRVPHCGQKAGEEESEVLAAVVNKD